jgi:predicted house-cleaning noncanonical NTP pyrophosphatase (MazG superfamily)
VFYASRHLAAENNLPAPEQFGQKALGLYRFPVEWTPPFLLVDRTAHERWRDAPAERDRLARSIVEEADRALVKPASSSAPIANGILVRSSAVREGIADRGQLESRYFDALTISGLTEFLRVLYSADVASTGGVGLILQAAVPVDRLIHLSNERRFSKTKNEWLISQSLPSSVFVPPEGCNSIKARALDEALALRITPGRLDRDLRAILRGVGKWANATFSPRVHFEIVLSGSRVFLVQVDVEEEVDGADPTSLALQFYPGDSASASLFTKFDYRQECCFQKLRNISDFETEGYKPPHRLFYATARTISETFADGGDDCLRREIERLTGGRLVIREDIDDDNVLTFNLYRSDTITTEEAIRQLKERVAYWANAGRSLDTVCFILHGFIPARASAWAMYSRLDKRVRIHALWGLPDGLQYLTPDEYELDLVTRGWSERIHFKEFFLRECADGAWRIEPVLLSVARTKVLSRPQSREIAKLTQNIGERLGSDVHIMFFCGIPKEAGVGEVLPWYRAREYSTYEAKREKRLQRIVVRRTEDLASIEPTPGVALSLTPDIENYRNNEFVTKVAEFAAAHDLPIEIQGSPLAHAYYILRRAGCTVFLSYAPAYERVRSKREFGKLVRDKIVQKIGGGGEQAISFHLPPNDRAPAFFGKLIEEGLEVLRAGSKDNRIMELADLYEVVRGWIESSDFEVTEVEAIADRKRQKSGGFTAAEVLVETGSKISSLASTRSPGLTLDRIATPKEHANRIEVPAARLGLIARGEPSTADLGDSGVSIRLSMTDEGDLVIEAVHHRAQAADGQLDLFSES